MPQLILSKVVATSCYDHHHSHSAKIVLEMLSVLYDWASHSQKIFGSVMNLTKNFVVSIICRSYVGSVETVWKVILFMKILW